VHFRIGGVKTWQIDHYLLFIISSLVMPPPPHKKTTGISYFSLRAYFLLPNRLMEQATEARLDPPDIRPI
jgi:hypothetical protein